MVQVDVTDNGPGMPPDVMDRIFSPFFTTKPQGTGLGLAIVRKIVNAHDGRIDVQVPAAGGTQFRVTLPVSSEQSCFGRRSGFGVRRGRGSWFMVRGSSSMFSSSVKRGLSNGPDSGSR